MDSDDFEALQRQREWFHGLRLLAGTWPVVRVDGRAFTSFTRSRFEKPFDVRFSAHMVATAEALLAELDGVFAFTQSDEISVLLTPQWDLFDRSVEKLLSISAGIASAVFTHACGEPGHFDSRIWLGTTPDTVVDYFSWRQSDAARCALNGWCYWALRSEKRSAREATALLRGMGSGGKNELLFQRGVNFNDLPAWQRRGIGISWETYAKEGFNPLLRQSVPVARRRLRVDRDLPMRDAFRDLVAGVVGAMI